MVQIKSNQIFVYCVNVKNRQFVNINIITIAVTDAVMIYREKVPKLTLFYLTISKDPVSPCDKLGGRFTH